MSGLSTRLKSLIEFYEGWFGISLLPHCTDESYKNYIRGVVGIVRSIIRDDSDVNIQFSNSDVAYCKHDEDNPNKILLNIPTSFLSFDRYEHLEDFEEIDGIAVSYYMLATVNFLVAHESLHSLYTPYHKKYIDKLIEEFHKLNPSAIGKQEDKIYSMYRQLLWLIQNLYEDNAIHAINWYNNYTIHIRNGIDTVVSEENFYKDKFEYEANQSINSVEPMQIVNMLSYLRNRKFINDEFYNHRVTHQYGETDLAKCRDLMIQSHKVTDYDDEYIDKATKNVVQIAYEIVSFDKFEEIWNSSGESDEINSLETALENLMYSGLINGNYDIAELLSAIEDIISNGVGESTSNVTSNPIMSSEELEFSVTDNGDNRDEVNEDSQDRGLSDSNPDVIFEDLTTSYGNTDNLPEIQPEYFVFANALENIRTVLNRKEPNQYSNTGKRVRSSKLHKYNSTGRIFRKNALTPTLEHDNEIIMLGDMSGSMRSRNLYITMLNALYSISVSLRDSGTKFGVYCHTTLPSEKSGEDAVVYFLGGQGYTFKSHQVGNIVAGFSNTNKIDLNGNNDADVIEYLSNNAFSSYKNRKFLFVLSDGQPIQTRKGYESGLDTYDYMRKVIQDARDNGIYVFGVALVESVIRMNNELYGKEYTIDATGNLESALMNLIELIQEGNI